MKYGIRNFALFLENSTIDLLGSRLNTRDEARSLSLHMICLCREEATDVVTRDLEKIRETSKAHNATVIQRNEYGNIFQAEFLYWGSAAFLCLFFIQSRLSTV